MGPKRLPRLHQIAVALSTEKQPAARLLFQRLHAPGSFDHVFAFVGHGSAKKSRRQPAKALGPELQQVTSWTPMRVAHQLVRTRNLRLKRCAQRHPAAWQATSKMHKQLTTSNLFFHNVFCWNSQSLLDTVDGHWPLAVKKCACGAHWDSTAARGWISLQPEAGPHLRCHARLVCCRTAVQTRTVP